MSLNILDVALGLIFIYLLLSLVCSALSELIESLVRRRSKDLERGIKNMLNGLEVEKIYNHPLIKSLYEGEYTPTKTKRNLPSYIPPELFAMALLDTLSKMNAADSSQGGVRLPLDHPIIGIVAPMAERAQGDLERLQIEIENWYKNVMERVSAWYKRYAQYWIVFIALVVTVLLNVDTLSLGQVLWHDDQLRQSIANSAMEYKGNGDTSQPLAVAQQKIEFIESLGMPLGWSKWPAQEEWPAKIAGWLLTILALSQGAPFWFDFLNKFVTIRSTIKPKAETA